MALGGCWVAPRRSWEDLSGSRDDLGSALGALGLSWWDLGGSGVVLGALLGVPGGVRGLTGRPRGVAPPWRSGLGFTVPPNAPGPGTQVYVYY